MQSDEGDGKVNTHTNHNLLRRHHLKSLQDNLKWRFMRGGRIYEKIISARDVAASERCAGHGKVNTPIHYNLLRRHRPASPLEWHLLVQLIALHIVDGISSSRRGDARRR